jgi:curved DNA-binding protein CbpA
MDSIFFDHSDALGIEKDATKAEIRIGYRKAALIYHPDKHSSNPTKFTAQFWAVQEAYEVLNDLYWKAIYDVENRHRRNRTRSGRLYATPKGYSRKAKNPPKSPENPFTNPNVFTGTNKLGHGPFDSGAYSFSFIPPDRLPKNSFKWAKGPYVNSTHTHFLDFKAGSVSANAPRSKLILKHSTSAPSDWSPWPKMSPEELASTASRFPSGKPIHNHLENLPRPNPSRPSPRNCTMMVCSISNTSLRFATRSRLLLDTAPYGMYQCTLHSHVKFQQSFSIPTELKEPGWYAFSLEGGNSNHNILQMHIGGNVTTFLIVSQCPCKTVENLCRCIFLVHGRWLPFEFQRFY